MDKLYRNFVLSNDKMLHAFSSISALGIIIILDINSTGQFTVLFFYYIIVIYGATKVGGWFSYFIAVLVAVSRFVIYIKYYKTAEVLPFELAWELLNFTFVYIYISYKNNQHALITKHLEQTSLTDHLTELLNRRGFDKRLHAAVGHAQRHDESIAVAFIDIDGFKAVNDEKGHHCGDLLLKIIARTISSCLRPEDVVARLGGDEFAIIMVNADYNGASNTIQRVKKRLDKKVAAEKFDVTFSIGVISYSGKELINPDDMIQQADELMYTVKHASKNGIKVEEYQPPM